MQMLKILAMTILLTLGSALAQQPKDPDERPKHGVVPDAETAIKIAVAVWEPIYGRDNIAKQTPFRASLTDGVWTVRGTLPQNWRGGVAEAEIAKIDGRILRVSHGI